MHVHLNVIDAITTFLYVIIVGFFWRIVAAMNANTAIGQAMGFLY
ncbi:MAG TPA: hypothetical protein VFK47_21660 [Ktedonobacteraceae bacterium]|nr:hypothetical protein [Ktedonobacteraceae bacterium]